MSRLTKKEYKHLVYSSGYYNKKQTSKFDEVYHKLGQLEDLMEELNIDNVEELGEYIHDLNIYVGAYANDPPEKTQQIVKDLNTVAKLRKKLGCHLEVVFEALKEGIILSNKELYSCEITYHKNQNEWVFVCYINNEPQVGVNVKQYKKTWWLPSDKEWKDE